MNDKRKLIEDVIDAVVESCIVDDSDINMKSCVLSDDKHENVVMTRVMVAYSLRYLCGNSITTIAKVLNKSERAVKNMLVEHRELLDTSNAYFVAYREAKEKINGIIGNAVSED